MPAHLESYYKPIDLPKGKKMKKAKVHEAILDCDVWINVPILKNHGGANLTISMKNHMGIVWDRGFFHQNDLQQCIADICTLQKKAVLNVVDAYRIMKTNGPRGTLCIRCCIGKRIVYLTGYCSRGYGCCQVLQSST